MNIENNKIIAEFLGWTLDDEELNTYRKKISVIFHYRKFNFQTDWNDLMEVVEKINVLGYEVLIGRINCQINNMLEREKPISAMVCGDVSKKIEITFDAVIQFIKWYNEQKQN